MSHLGNVPSGSLVDAAEKLVASMNEQDLAAELVRRSANMSPEARSALVGATLDAFRDRGESSEDAAEACGAPLESIERSEPDAVAQLLRYAAANVGVVKEATTLFVEQHPTLIAALPDIVTDGIWQRLSSAR